MDRKMKLAYAGLMALPMLGASVGTVVAESKVLWALDKYGVSNEYLKAWTSGVAGGIAGSVTGTYISAAISGGLRGAVVGGIAGAIVGATVSVA